MTHLARPALISNKAWTRIILFLWLSLLTIAQAQAVLREWRTTDHWLSVRSVTVGDSDEGRCPAIGVAGIVHRPFVGGSVSTVFVIETEEGELYPPAGGMRLAYIPGTRMPKWMDLDRWMGWPDCSHLHAGKYFIRTAWEINAPGYPAKFSPPVDSNVFEIRSPH